MSVHARVVAGAGDRRGKARRRHAFEQQAGGRAIGLKEGDGGGEHPLHHPCYDFNDGILPLGAALFVRLGVWQLERVDAVAGWPEMLLQGLRVDIATLCWIWGVPAMLTMLDRLAEEKQAALG